MDDPEATTRHFSLSKEDASDSISYPTINKQRKSSESKLKLSQICDTSPDPDFRTELVVYDSSKESRSRRKRAMIDDLYDHSKVHSPVIEQAEELRANLEASFPSFWKAMVKSNVTHGFWLHLPMRFCKLHMPKTDTVFTLENESGGEYKVNYISQRTALSGGWKAFCDSNGLNESDVLVFHLIAPLRFKVFIVRANGISNVTAEAKPLNLVPLDIDSEAKINDQTEKEKKSKKRAKQLKSPGFIQHDIQNSTLMVLETTNGHVIDQFENGRVDLGPITSEGLQSSESPCNFKEVKSVDNFTILVNDLAIDSELSDHHRTKYYELCSSQNSFLHNHLLKSINCKLAAEIITQTVNIAEAVRACNLSTSRADYEVWDKTLKGFELLGMNVSFLRARLNRLMSFTLESEESMELKRLKEVTVEKSRAEEEMRALELKLLTLKETMGRLDYKVESLKAKAGTHALKFQEEVNAPW